MKKRQYKKQHKQIIVSIIILSILIIVSIIYILKRETYSTIEPKKYYTGDILSPNYSANLIDNITTKDNIVISPYNYINTLSILYNGSDNNTYKVLKKYLGNNLNTQNEIIIPTIIKLNNKEEYDTKIESYYLNLIKELNNKEYNNLIPKTIKLLPEEEKNNLVLNLTKINMTYALLNNEYPYDLTYIKKYTLTKKEQTINETEIYNLLKKVLDNYETYLIQNIIKNNNIIIYNKNNLPNIKINKEFNNIIKEYNSTIIEYNNKTNIKELNNKIKELTNYNYYLDEDILNNNDLILLN